MPIKNAALYIEECLESILIQDFIDWELLAINDHSTDGTLSILHRYADVDSRISIALNKGIGIIPALQTGYELSNGSIITRMDADDIMTRDKLMVLHQILIDNGRNTVATGKVKYFSESVLGDGYKKYESWLNNLCINNTQFDEIYKECAIPSPCWMIHKIDFDRCGGFDSDRYPEDYDLVFRWYAKGIKPISSTNVLHHWRDYDSRSSRTDENYMDNRFLSLKTDWFLSIDYDKTKPLYLWGAGKKAKKIAKLLLAQNIDFHWISNNQNKIGHNIYGIIIADQSTIVDNCQVIITIANPQELQQIKSKMTTKSSDTYYFS